MTSWARRAHGQPALVVAHRGGRGPEVPVENTIAAFEHARGQGARAMELDVRACADEEIVVVHDVDLARITDGTDPRRVDDLEWRELAAVRLPGGARIPRLADVIDWAEAHDIALNVEVKRDGGHWPALVRRTGVLARHAKVDMLLSSFDPALLTALTPFAPKVPRAWLVDPVESPRLSLMLAFTRQPLVQALHPRHDQITAPVAALVRSRAIALGAYTVNDEAEARRLIELGVDWLITDRPASILALAAN